MLKCYMYMKPKVNELLIPEDIFEGITIDGHADYLGHVIKAILGQDM